MRIDFEEDAILIDNVINHETERAIQKDMADMVSCGCLLPNPKHIREYTYDMREAVQNVFETCN